EHVDNLVDVVRNGAPRARPVGPPGLAARPPGARIRRALRERRRLPLRRAPRCLQLLLEPIALLFEPIAFFLQALPLVLDPLPLALGPLQLAPQALVLLPQPLDLAFAVVPRRRPPPPGHRHGCKKAYLGLRIYNALRRGTLTEYITTSRLRMETGTAHTSRVQRLRSTTTSASWESRQAHA